MASLSEKQLISYVWPSNELLSLVYSSRWPPKSTTKRFKPVRPGSGPRLYAVHGLDGDVLGYSYGSLAQQLAGWRVAALKLDDEALACRSLTALAACYNRRVTAGGE